MKRLLVSMVLLAIMAVTLVACGGDTSTPTSTATSIPVPTEAPKPSAESTPMTSDNLVAPDTTGQDGHITVQHILIAFKDALGFQGQQAPPKAAARTQEEAKTLAYEILEKAKAGEDYDKLVQDNTDDRAPGIYTMSNIGVPPTSQDEFPRDQMVPAFGNVGFDLKVGDIGIADYDPQSSPFGYHIIKRIALAPTPTPVPKRVGEDDHIEVQHILLGFKDATGFGGQAPAKAAARTQEEAKTLAYELVERAKAGEDYDKLVETYTDDQAPGIYLLANDGVEAGAGEAPRAGMVKAFGDVGFALKVGDIGVADYDVLTSPFGYHVIKRTK